jgi:hypothetical protein
MPSGYNSALLMIFTILTTLVSFGVAVYEYNVTRVLRVLIEEAHTQVMQRMQAAGVEGFDLRGQLVEMSPTLFFISSFVAVLCLGAFLRIMARIRFKQNIVQGHMSLFRIPDSWVWALVVFAAFYFFSLKSPALQGYSLFIKNGLFIMLFLYLLQGVGVASLFFEVRLFPSHWLTLGVLLTGIWVPELITFIAIFFVFIGLTEVWLALRKRSLRPVTNTNQG